MKFKIGDKILVLEVHESLPYLQKLKVEPSIIVSEGFTENLYGINPVGTNKKYFVDESNLKLYTESSIEFFRR